MGLAGSKPFDIADNYKITYHAATRAAIEVVNFKKYNELVGYGKPVA